MILEAEQVALAAEAERLTREARTAVAKLHSSLTSKQHACERRLSYAYDCLGDAIGYLADAKTFVTNSEG
jgi:hypothetical protein